MTATLPPVPLDARLARRLAKLAGKVETSIAERDEAIAEAVASGASLREIAAVAGMSHVTVKNILDRRKAK